MSGDMIPKEDTLGGLAQILSLVSGKKTTSTKKTDISQTGVDAMLKQILEGTQGLAAVSSGQSSSGLYNSNVNSMLTNDLLARSTGQVAALSAPEVTTTVTDPALNPKIALGGLGLGVLANNLGLFNGGANSGGTTGLINGLFGGLKSIFSPSAPSSSGVRAPTPSPGSTPSGGIDYSSGSMYQNGTYDVNFADNLTKAFDTYYTTGNTSFFDNLTKTNPNVYDPKIADAIWGPDAQAGVSKNNDWTWLNSLAL